MKIKTSELTGAALDWAVAVALGWEIERPQDGQFIDKHGHRWLAGQHDYAPRISFSPSTNWAQGGPLVDQFKPHFTNQSGAGYVKAVTPSSQAKGETYLIAICRAVVACKLGEEVEVPEELGGAA